MNSQQTYLIGLSGEEGVGGNLVAGFPHLGGFRGSPPTSLDPRLQNSPPKPRIWTPKQKRAYHRLLSGIKRGEAFGERIRFMTLTSAPGSERKRLNKDFAILVKRIRRRFGRFEYWKIRTNEGHGVIHVVFKGPYLPQRWLSDQWLEIHGAPIVDIRQFRFGSRRLARYLVGNYLCKQTFERMSWSWNWVFWGFVSVWRKLIEELGYPKALEYWNWILSLKDPPPLLKTRQTLLIRICERLLR
jgi:hypothetical protein